MPSEAARPEDRRNRQEGNPFATDAVIADLIAAFGAAYLAAPNARISRTVKVEGGRGQHAHMQGVEAEQQQIGR
jgi:hypothetical protein